MLKVKILVETVVQRNVFYADATSFSYVLLPKTPKPLILRV